MRYLNESIEVHSRLNPLIWDENNRLREEVKEQLTLIVDEFITELEENDIPVRVLDTYIVGSNASYNYTENSDLDVHIVVNMSEITCDPTILNLLYNYFKSYFNDKYDISIHGIDVELYVEDVNSSSVSNGIYSLSDEEWIKFPEPVKMNKIDISDDIQPYVNMYRSAVNANDGLEAQMLVDDLYLLRKNSLSKDGEFGVGNLIFKEFRDNGWLDTLKEISNEYKSTQLSLEGLEEKLQEVVNYQDIDYMIEVARSNHPTPRDIFQTPWDYLVDPTEFFNELTKNASPDYRRKARNRILSNDKTNEFYKVVLGYLDSIGTGYKGYPKLEPALVKEYEDELIPQDGRHRALLCKWLGIKLPVRVSNQGANGKFESTNVPFNKESGHKRKYTKLSSTHKFEHNATSVQVIEAYLDDAEEFYDYRTASVDGSNIFDTNRGESTFAQDMIKLAKTGEQDSDGHIAKFVMMSPNEYFDACAKGFGIPASTQKRTVGEHDKKIIQKLTTVIDKYKVRFPVTYLDYSHNKFGQEGRHRMFIAGEKFGWDTKFPVLIINTTEEATRRYNEENVIRNIAKALRNTKMYTFSDFEDIQEQFKYDIERYIEDPVVKFDENDKEYIFIVNGVRYPEDKEEFNFFTQEQEDETDTNDLDIEDMLDLDDFDDEDIFNV